MNTELLKRLVALKDDPHITEYVSREYPAWQNQNAFIIKINGISDDTYKKLSKALSNKKNKYIASRPQRSNDDIKKDHAPSKTANEESKSDHA